MSFSKVLNFGKAAKENQQKSQNLSVLAFPFSIVYELFTLFLNKLTSAYYFITRFYLNKVNSGFKLV